MAVPRLGLDFIGQINPPSLKGHRFVLVATYYFTKWTEAVPLKNMTHKEVIEFITVVVTLRSGDTLHQHYFSLKCFLQKYY